ncbi:hypothetical protein [Hymenobacter jeollabukensis]|uniref:Uncharacterized protein n=1 Tax=Hymenobacter jeollabukensis TaxID=2025313 RepID=A0A5R8WX95_9BACT|nr:hypothetical protein [Hymenobacter jeollabukensis]TLM96989.1 hypothetical protein FDY95_03080 [Hymenobacter jeollabukensis]
MTREEALDAARRYIAQCNAETPLHPDYYLVVGQPVEYRQLWYFDNCTAHRPGLPHAARSMQFAGAPGYVIGKRSRRVQEIGWADFSALRKLQQQLQYFEQRVAERARQPLTLRELRQYFTMSLPELQAFKRQLEEPEQSVAQLLLLLEQRLIEENCFLIDLMSEHQATY